MSHDWKPTGYTSVAPYLISANATRVIEFLQTVLGATALRRYDMPDGTIMHAEVRIDDTVVMIGEAGGAWTPVPCHLHVYTADVDETYARALQSGAESVEAPRQRPGD